MARLFKPLFRSRHHRKQPKWNLGDPPPPPRRIDWPLVMLLSIPGDNTYSNYAEANRSFWRQTVCRPWSVPPRRCRHGSRAAALSAFAG